MTSPKKPKPRGVVCWLCGRPGAKSFPCLAVGCRRRIPTPNTICEYCVRRALRARAKKGRK